MIRMLWRLWLAQIKPVEVLGNRKVEAQLIVYLLILWPKLRTVCFANANKHLVKCKKWELKLSLQSRHAMPRLSATLWPKIQSLACTCHLLMCPCSIQPQGGRLIPLRSQTHTQSHQETGAGNSVYFGATNPRILPHQEAAL